MLRRLFIFTSISGIVTFLINHYIPNLEARIWWFMLFGLLFYGIVWTIKEIENTITGIIIGALAGYLVDVVVALAENTLVGADFVGADLLYFIFKWIIPIVLYSGIANLPWI